jgi:hypothetical protein
VSKLNYIIYNRFTGYSSVEVSESAHSRHDYECYTSSGRIPFSEFDFIFNQANRQMDNSDDTQTTADSVRAIFCMSNTNHKMESVQNNIKIMFFFLSLLRSTVGYSK